MIYFTSDLHFYHDNVIRHCGRPFASSDEMNRAIIQNWNYLVRPQDEVYILGDVTMKGPDRAMEMLGQLKGRKYLLRGNHDYFIDKSGFEPHIFEWVRDYYELKYQNGLFVLCHYPMVEWNRSRHGSYHLHGHQHNKADYNLANRENGVLRYDVGVDANGYKPVSIEQIIEFFGGAYNG